MPEAVRSEGTMQPSVTETRDKATREPLAIRRPMIILPLRDYLATSVMDRYEHMVPISAGGTDSGRVGWPRPGGRPRARRPSRDIRYG